MTSVLPVLVFSNWQVVVGVLPAVALMIYIYHKDRVEKEPVGLLLMLAAAGAVSCFPAGLIEQILITILDLLPVGETLYLLILAYVVVALAEEGCKLFFLRLVAWKHPSFNFRFDGILYAAFVSLGFAALENVRYVMAYGIEVAPSRALLSVPAHFACAIFMGIFFSEAKLAELRGMRAYRRTARNLSLLVPAFLHGTYDFLAMKGTGLTSLLLLAFVIVLDISIVMLIRRHSSLDHPLYYYRQAAQAPAPPYGPEDGQGRY